MGPHHEVLPESDSCLCAVVSLCLLLVSSIVKEEHVEQVVCFNTPASFGERGKDPSQHSVAIPARWDSPDSQ